MEGLFALPGGNPGGLQNKRSEEQGEGRAICDTAVFEDRKKKKKKKLDGNPLRRIPLKRFSEWWSGTNVQSYLRHQTTYILTDPQIDVNEAIYVFKKKFKFSWKNRMNAETLAYLFKPAF